MVARKHTVSIRHCIENMERSQNKNNVTVDYDNVTRISGEKPTCE